MMLLALGPAGNNAHQETIAGTLPLSNWGKMMVITVSQYGSWLSA